MFSSLFVWFFLSQPFCSRNGHLIKTAVICVLLQLSLGHCCVFSRVLEVLPRDLAEAHQALVPFISTGDISFIVSSPCNFDPVSSQELFLAPASLFFITF